MRLAANMEDADILDCRTLVQDVLAVFRAKFSSLSRSGPKIFTELSPLTPEHGLHDVVADVLREIPDDAGHLLPSNSAFMSSHNLVLGAGAHGAKEPLSPAGLRGRFSASPFPDGEGTKYSLFSYPDVSVASSGRPD